jgi:hypothetical protein
VLRLGSRLLFTNPFPVANLAPTAKLETVKDC